MASKRVRQNIDTGLWTNYGHPADGYSAAAYRLEDTQELVLFCYKEEMPPFSRTCYASLEELEDAMRDLSPLRKWRTRFPD